MNKHHQIPALILRDCDNGNLQFSAEEIDELKAVIEVVAHTSGWEVFPQFVRVALVVENLTRVYWVRHLSGREDDASRIQELMGKL